MRNKQIYIDKFLEKAKKIHNHKYDYTCMNYEHSTKKISILCNIHGEFKQTPSMHLMGQGCPKCANEKVNILNRLTTEQFITKSKNLFLNKFDYFKCVYTGTYKEVILICKYHGEFKIQPNTHLNSKYGCPYCAKLGKNNNVEVFDTKSFKEKAVKVHGDLYGYEDSIYKSARDLIIINCKIHGNFKQKAATHLAGRGCNKCRKAGFNINEPGTLYYLYLPEYNLYKIGITNRSVKLRFSKEDQNKFNILKTWEFPIGSMALTQEKHLLNLYKKFKYKGKRILKSGNTELFTKDILNLN